MDCISLPGARDNAAPTWLCVSPYKSSMQDQSEKRSTPVWVRLANGSIVAFESQTECAAQLGINRYVIKNHLNRWWDSENSKGCQFASTYDMLIAVIKSKRKRKYDKRIKRNKYIIKYPDGSEKQVPSFYAIIRLTGVDNRTITNHLDKCWVERNPKGLQFSTIKTP